ncbi:MAG: hypothetical protein KDB03_18915 [Planctomycetales bacterium]|nr:hypothetical protein [Planctomycetales bacterium]
MGLGKYLSVLPSVVLALLPRLACPCQFPAYTSLLGSMGLTFLLNTTYLLPLTAACLTFAVGGLAVGAKRRQGLLPFWLGATAAVTLMVGKFVFPNSGLVYASIGILLLASFWNSWPGKQRPKIRFNADGEIELNGD